MFYEYYGDFDYADRFVMAALQGTSTNFSRGRGDADFAIVTIMWFSPQWPLKFVAHPSPCSPCVA